MYSRGHYLAAHPHPGHDLAAAPCPSRRAPPTFAAGSRNRTHGIRRLRRTGRSRRSERVLRGELDDSRIQRALNPSEGCRVETGLRSVEVRVIEHVEELKPHLDTVPFVNPERPVDAGICI